TSAEPDGVQRTKCDTFSVNEHQGFFGQQAAQVELNSAVSASPGVQVLCSPGLLWQKGCQVCRIANAQLFDVCRTICVHWIWADFFSCGNVRASDNDTFHLGHCARCHLRRQNPLSEKLGSDQQTNTDSSGETRSSYWGRDHANFHCQLFSWPLRVCVTEPTTCKLKIEASQRARAQPSATLAERTRRYLETISFGASDATIFSKRGFPRKGSHIGSKHKPPYVGQPGIFVTASSCSSARSGSPAQARIRA